MVTDGDASGKKILPLGQGDLDLRLLRDHPRQRLSRPDRHPRPHRGRRRRAAARQPRRPRLAACRSSTASRAGPKPKPRTHDRRSAAAPPARLRGWLAEGKPEYRTPPLTVECRAKLNTQGRLTTSWWPATPRQSGAHWETLHDGRQRHAHRLPARHASRIMSARKIDICDGKWHDVAMQYEAEPRAAVSWTASRSADQEVEAQRQGRTCRAVWPSAGWSKAASAATATLDWVRISQRDSRARRDRRSRRRPTTTTIGLWTFRQAGQASSKICPRLKNPAKRRRGAPAPSRPPPPGGPTCSRPIRSCKVDADRPLARTTPTWRVKVDSQGRVFVGGREAVFVFEPDGKGGYRAAPRAVAASRRTRSSSAWSSAATICTC